MKNFHCHCFVMISKQIIATLLFFPRFVKSFSFSFVLVTFSEGGVCSRSSTYGLSDLTEIVESCVVRIEKMILSH